MEGIAVEPSKQRRIFTGCAIGCVGLVVLLVGSCVGLTRWLNAPVGVLETQQLLDEEAVGYVEWRMELDHPGTQRFFDAGIDLMDARSRGMEQIPFVNIFLAWNQRRQEKELKRLFPATGSWMLYPHGFGADAEGDSRPDSLGQMYALSVSRLGNQLRIADWLGGFAISRVSDQAVARYGDERIYTFDPTADPLRQEGDEAREPDLEIRTDRHEEVELASIEQHAGGPVHIFLRREGFFLATEEAVAKRAVDQFAAEPRSREATQLERLFATVPDSYQLRGAVLNHNGELAELLNVLIFSDLLHDRSAYDDEQSETPLLTDDEIVELQAAVAKASSAVIGGTIQADGSSQLEVTFQIPQDHSGPLADQMSRLGDLAARSSSEHDMPLRSQVEVAGSEVQWRLRFDDLVSSLEGKLEDVTNQVTREVQREISRGPRVKVRDER